MTKPKSGPLQPGKDGKVFKTFRLPPDTVTQLEQVAQGAGVPPSTIVEVLVRELLKHDWRAVNWTGTTLPAASIEPEPPEVA